MKQTDKYWEKATDPTHKETLGERKKKRRQYLWTTENAQALWIIGVVFWGAGLTGLSFGLSVIARLFPFGEIPSRLLAFALCVLVAVVGAIMTEYSSERRQGLTYIPPVSDRVADLPAEEILVRGSDQPAAAPDELLRAANASTETASDVLLRPGGNVTP